MNSHDQRIIKEHNDVRILNGVRKQHELPTLTPEKRTCLKCSKFFKSESINNRMCYKCKLGI